MKRLLVLASMIVLVAGSGCAKEKEVELNTTSQKASYAVGLQVAKSLGTFPVEFNRAAFVAALNDTLDGKEPRLSQEQISSVFAELQSQAQKDASAAAEKNLERGKAFLAENAKKEGVTTTASGLQYTVLTKGKGKKPSAKDTVEVHYRGTTIDGKEFDSSHKRGAPATLGVTQVIPGWIEALQIMTVGSKYKLFIPSHLAYGPRGAGADIGPNEVLIFDIQLLAIK